MSIPAPDFAAMFSDGARFTWRDGEEAVISLLSAGDLLLPTGRIVACDPYFGIEFDDELKAFTVAVAPGSYPVVVATVGWTQAGQPLAPDANLRTAAAKVLVGDGEPVRWELALVHGQRVENLADNEFYGYGVDAGTGCFFDISAVGALKALVAEDEDRFGASPLSDAQEASAWTGAVNLTAPDGSANLIAFESGPGDGCYPTWVGFDAEDRPACFVSEFEFLRHAVPVGAPTR